MNKKYNTRQKMMIIDILKKQNHEFTIRDIYNDANQKIGLTTIYRLIDTLVNEGLVIKSIMNNKSYYEYLEHCSCDNHFYLKCEKCSELVHVDCDCICDLWNHISQNHHFLVGKDNIIIKGICEECQRKESC